MIKKKTFIRKRGQSKVNHAQKMLQTEAENKMSISYIVNEFDVPPTASDSQTEQPVIMFPGANKLSLSPFYTHWASDA